MFVFGKVVWFGKKVMQEYNQKIEQGLDRAAIMLVNDIVKSFGSPPTPPEGGPKTITGQKMTAKRWRQVHHSQPGEPPFVQTGALRRSITFSKPAPRTRHVGSTLKPQGDSPSYAYILERGIGMEARPYLRPALIRNKKEITKLVAHG
jgi:hypothetical protein